MVASAQLSPGMVVNIKNQLLRVESAVKVTVAKGQPFMKVKLKDINTDKMTEKKLKPDQEVNEVTLEEKELEYLYPDEKRFAFLDIKSLEQLFVEKAIVGNRTNYLKEGVEVVANAYGESIFAIELPQFLELMVSDIKEDKKSKAKLKTASGDRLAILETGAHIEVPPFVEVGDVVKVDTRSDEFIQRV